MSNETWKEIVNETGLNYTQRAISKALVLICVLHEERTPSLFLYPSGNYVCYGCGDTGGIEDIKGLFEVIKNVHKGIYTPKYDWMPDEYRYQKYIEENGYPPAESFEPPEEEGGEKYALLYDPFDADKILLPIEILEAPLYINDL